MQIFLITHTNTQPPIKLTHSSTHTLISSFLHSFLSLIHPLSLSHLLTDSLSSQITFPYSPPHFISSLTRPPSNHGIFYRLSAFFPPTLTEWNGTSFGLSLFCYRHGNFRRPNTKNETINKGKKRRQWWDTSKGKKKGVLIKLLTYGFTRQVRCSFCVSCVVTRKCRKMRWCEGLLIWLWETWQTYKLF